MAAGDAHRRRGGSWAKAAADASASMAGRCGSGDVSYEIWTWAPSRSRSEPERWQQRGVAQDSSEAPGEEPHRACVEVDSHRLALVALHGEGRLFMTDC